MFKSHAFDKSFQREVHVDASGKVLMQDVRPIAHKSNKLDKHKRRWPNHGKKFFVMVYYLKRAIITWYWMH